MPEGHTIHRLAKDYATAFAAGQAPFVTSPQGKFADAAALLTGTPSPGTEAHGKHLFLGFGAAEPAEWVHIHLGLFGKVTFEDPAPRPRTPSASAWRTTPRTSTSAPHHLRPDHRPGEAGDTRPPRPRPPAPGRRPAGGLPPGLPQPLHHRRAAHGPEGHRRRRQRLPRRGPLPPRHRPVPPRPDLTPTEWDAIWHDLTDLMREGVRNNRIDTVRPEHTPEAMGRPPRVDDHGGEVYVYRRANQSCHSAATRSAPRTSPPATSSGAPPASGSPRGAV